jgi:protein-L-isoaspartate(D-aspartate) O-methyltransferase
MKRTIFITALLLLVGSLAPAQDYEALRERMLRGQIRARDIWHQPTLKAMGKVERHLFVPDEYKEHAYSDGPLPIGFGQTISQPYIVAYMTQIINPKPDYRVLEIGTGSGYQAAILAEIVDKVYTIEIISSLGNSAKERLKTLNYQNVEVFIADGYYGLKEAAPFDAIIVTAAAEFIPPPLIEQLKEGGKMIIPVGSPFIVQTLMLVEKKNGKTNTKSLMPVRFVPFTRSQ